MATGQSDLTPSRPTTIPEEALEDQAVVFQAAVQSVVPGRISRIEEQVAAQQLLDPPSLHDAELVQEVKDALLIIHDGVEVRRSPYPLGARVQRA
eukprot:scaffold4626_cov114-Pinguiococcus_pyrenoidosus.AAC.1